MTIVTENDLKELGAEIKETNQKIDKLTEMMIDFKISLSETKLPDLAEKVGELKNWRTIAVMVISAFINSLFWIFRTGKL
jgi:hypothetical protein